jgi:DNA-binding response OmpR family regulator
MADDGRARILIAEGDKDARAAVMWCLLAEGFWVDPVANGFDAAISLEAGRPPDLAIIDLGLQGFGGRRLVEQMCGSDRLKDVPIIATGLTEPYAPLPAGVVFLKKPCNLEQLVRTVRELGRGSLRSFFPSKRPRAADPLPHQTARRAGKRD